MEKLKVNFINCYGIRSLKSEFDFQSGKVYAIYASNGVMKTSFAKAMLDHSKGKNSEDRIYKKRETIREVVDENGSSISPEMIFVIESYNEDFKSKKISTLLVNKLLKTEYDNLHSIIYEMKELLISGLKKSSGLKKDIEETVSEAISNDSNKFFISLSCIKDKVQNQNPSDLGKINYSTIFNDKVLALLEDIDFKEKLNEYINLYDRLTESSSFFKKGVFTHNNAADIAKSLGSNGYFTAAHTVNININGQKKEISTLKDLEEAIKQEKEVILGNKELASSFENIDAKISGNVVLKKFRDCLERNPFILLELKNLKSFKQKLWVAYLVENIDAYMNLLKAYESGKIQIEDIIQKAKEEKTQWCRVINIFNERFSVPFIVTMENKDDVILNSKSPNIKFEFKDSENEETVLIEKNELLHVLCSGEKRALYILNIIFEVEARKESGQETLFIIDDIVDSFDYKNKYAIIEYLNDISSKDGFYQIILSHNFDSYRTICGRLHLGRAQRLHTLKTSKDVQLVVETYQKNPFDTWKQNIGENTEMLIASITFIRNLAEYCGYDNEFQKLTALLHQKSSTDLITIADLQEIIGTILKDKSQIRLPDGMAIVKNVIYNTANLICSKNDELIELEKKIVLSIAIRLRTEQFMISKINDPSFVEEIKTNQTYALIMKYKTLFPSEKGNIQLIERVNLMTPENIHLNSFMYEPILDMSCNHLKKLYQDVIALA